MKIIVAVYSDWGIGSGGNQTIVLPEDRRFFSNLTAGGVVIAGRKTFDEICKPLPDRKNIILTRDRGYTAAGAVTVHSFGEALNEIAVDDPDKIFVIGGGEIYRLFLPMCSYAYVTKIDTAPLSDTFFPNLDVMQDWSLESRSEVQNSECGIWYSFNIYKNVTNQ